MNNSGFKEINFKKNDNGRGFKEIKFLSRDKKKEEVRKGGGKKNGVKKRKRESSVTLNVFKKKRKMSNSKDNANEKKGEKEFEKCLEMCKKYENLIDEVDTKEDLFMIIKKITETMKKIDKNLNNKEHLFKILTENFKFSFHNIKTLYDLFTK